MSRCDKLRPFLDGELQFLDGWMMRRHMRRCASCARQAEADNRIGDLLADEFRVDGPGEAEAARRATDRWIESIPRDAPVSVPVRLPIRRWASASAAVALVVGVL